MPVTARLSRKFYERFGDEIAGEFVDWFNAVDSTYQQQLRELNDLNWERFKAEMDVRITQCEGRLSEKFSDKLADTKADISCKVSEIESRLMKWMFIYWSGTVLSLGGLMVAVLAILVRR